MSKVGVHWNGSELEVSFSAMTMEEFDREVDRARAFAIKTIPTVTPGSISNSASDESEEFKEIGGYWNAKTREEQNNIVAVAAKRRQLNKDKYGL